MFQCGEASRNAIVVCARPKTEQGNCVACHRILVIRHRIIQPVIDDSPEKIFEVVVRLNAFDIVSATQLAVYRLLGS